LNDRGYGEGSNYALNVPLNRGIDDDTYFELFKTVGLFLIYHLSIDYGGSKIEI
jgi:acetoin utilization deacetylase AcuC-like enzyme